LAGWNACVECDSKKIIALSTLSQLGIIITGLGLGLRSLVFTHLLAHAVFKALLFVTVGCFIHTQYGSQELRSAFVVSYCSCFIFVTFTVCLLCLGGFCFISGYYTKEGLLVAGFSRSWGLFPLLLFYVSVGLTVCYRTRLWANMFTVSLSSVPFTPNLGGGSLIKLPSFLLLATLFWQTVTYSHCLPLASSCLDIIDSLVVYLWLFLGFCLGHVVFRYGGPSIMPLAWLSRSVC